MMKNLLILILLLSGISSLGYGQINDQIKGSASSNNNSTSNNGGGGNSGGGGSGGGSSLDGGLADGCGGACLESCVQLGCLMAIEGIARGMWSYNRRIMDKKPDVPRVISLDVIPQAGIGLNTPNTWILAPRVRANLGFFSTDFRFYNRLETGVDYIDTWKTLEWQILQFNLVQGRHGNFRIGSGIYYETFTGALYNESTVGLSLFAPRIGGVLDLEYRITPDYANGEIPRQEANFGLRKILIDTPHLHIYGVVRGAYQNFYRGIEAWSGVAGLHINLH